MSNKTRQNNKGADRKVESNDSPEYSRQGGDIRRARPDPSGNTCRKVKLDLQFASNVGQTNRRVP